MMVARQGDMSELPTSIVVMVFLCLLTSIIALALAVGTLFSMDGTSTSITVVACSQWTWIGDCVDTIEFVLPGC